MGACEALEVRILPTVAFTVAFEDPGGANAAYYTELTQVVLAAGADWAQYLDGTATLDVVVAFADLPPGALATGASETIVPVGNVGGVDVYQEGAVSEIITGVDPNGADPDIRITIDAGSLNHGLWLDPTPYSNGEQVPIDQTDGVSLIKHELGHALGILGFGNETDGSLPGTDATTFDQFVTFDGSNFYFTGPEAMATYGGPVPLTFGNHFHVGNPGVTSRPGSDLLDLMNPLLFAGSRYEISDLDLAILSDIGVPIKSPAPPSAGVSLDNGVLTAVVPEDAKSIQIKFKNGKHGDPDQLIVKIKGERDFTVAASSVDSIVVVLADSRTKVKVAKKVDVRVQIVRNDAQRVPAPLPVAAFDVVGANARDDLFASDAFDLN